MWDLFKHIKLFIKNNSFVVIDEVEKTISHDVEVTKQFGWSKLPILIYEETAIVEVSKANDEFQIRNGSFEQQNVVNISFPMIPPAKKEISRAILSS